jgi:valyl-tRNA synthetase
METGLRLLSPFMPFLSEELWQRLPTLKDFQRAPSICVAPYPSGTTYKLFESETNDREVAFMNDVIHSIRSTRAAYNLPNKTKTEAYILNSETELNEVLLKEKATICALSFSQDYHIVSRREEVPPGTATAVVSDKCTAFIPLKGIIDFEFEKDRISKQLLTITEQLAKLEGVMNVETYVERVPAAVREKDAQKLAALQGERKQLQEALQSVLVFLGYENPSSSSSSDTESVLDDSVKTETGSLSSVSSTE